MFKYRLIILLLVCIAHTAYALNDPTRPSTFKSAKVASKALNLESILISDERKVAVINGSVVAEGERVGVAEIVAINKDGVDVSSGGKNIRLVLESASIRQEK